MDSTIKVFKSFFADLWVEHLLYAYFIDKTIDITLKKLEKFCTVHDWDAELSLDRIIQDDDNERIIARLRDSIQNGECGCGLCRILKRNAENNSEVVEEEKNVVIVNQDFIF